MSISLTSNFFSNARGLTIADGGGVTWAFNKNTNTLSVSGLSGVGIAPGSVSNADLANMAGSTIKGNNGGSPAAPSDLTVAQVKTLLALTYTDVGGLATVAHTGAYGDLTGPPSIPAAANPTGSVGLAAVNGSAATFMRSDATPLLSQTITPTWTNPHTFTSAGTTNAAVVVSAADANIRIRDTGGTADTREWRIRAAAGQLLMYCSNDAFSTATLFLQVTRSTAAVAAVNFGNATDNPTFAFQGSGAVSVGGSFGINGVAPPAKPTGYGTPTGNALTSSFAAGSISLANLAAEVAQLVLDLKKYGIIGA